MVKLPEIIGLIFSTSLLNMLKGAIIMNLISGKFYEMVMKYLAVKKYFLELFQ